MTENTYYPLKKGEAQSETSFWINFAAFWIATSVLALSHIAGISKGVYLFIIFALSITTAQIALETLFYRKTSVYLKWRIQRPIVWKRIFYKEVALLVTLSIIALLYWLLPMYRARSFTSEYFPFLQYLVPFIVVLSVPYFALMDRIDDNPEDIYFKIGKAIIYRQKSVSRFELGNYVRNWLIKAFWLALMQPYMVHDIYWFIHLSWENLGSDPMRCFLAANTFCFFMDLSYASTGYLVNLKILNSQTRTAEPTLFGWLVAIMCYWPFWGILFYPNFFRYEEISWLSVFQTGSFVWWVWFAIIISLELLYALATIAAGIRFSNLTYRGLWNTGLYKYTKHPAYVFKNISWWFIAVPFLASTPALCLKLSLLLFGNNLIYYFRAKTEERHLSHYPEYVEYALSMNEKSIFKWAAKIFPFLKYKPLEKKDRLF